MQPRGGFSPATLVSAFVALRLELVLELAILLPHVEAREEPKHATNEQGDMDPEDHAGTSLENVLFIV